MKLRVASLTDRGLNPNRTHNEDNHYVTKDMFIVADGLGGELAGEVASQMTIEKFNEFFIDATRGDLSIEGELETIERTIHRVNTIVHEEAQKPEYKNMGSTLSILYLYMNYALIGHVGDSKVYRVRQGEFDQLSHDQSIVQQMLDKGIISPEQARRHPMRNVLLGCIAHKAEIEVYTRYTKVEPGDFFLLCSDGVSEYVPPDMIVRLSKSHTDPQSLCNEIKEIVYRGGAMDNLTAIAVYVDEVDAL